jgi:hypothetical protein
MKRKDKLSELPLIGKIPAMRSSISIRHVKSSDHLLVRVSDDGKVLSKQKRQHIFLNRSKRKGHSAIKAVNRAKLIPNLNPDDVIVLKVCG